MEYIQQNKQRTIQSYKEHLLQLQEMLNSITKIQNFLQESITEGDNVVRILTKSQSFSQNTLTSTPKIYKFYKRRLSP